MLSLKLCNNPFVIVNNTLNYCFKAKRRYCTFYEVRNSNKNYGWSFVWSKYSSRRCVHEDSKIPHVDSVVYYRHLENTIHSIAESIDEIMSTDTDTPNIDVNLSDGMLVIDIENLGQYVINRQTAAKQLWLSSPVSGPKHFNLELNDSSKLHHRWICSKSGVELGSLLSTEFTDALGFEVELLKN